MYFKNPYYTKQENLKEMDKSLVIYGQPKLNLDQISYDVNRPMNPREQEAVIKSLPAKNIWLRPDGFSTEFYQTFKKSERQHSSNYLAK